MRQTGGGKKIRRARKGGICVPHCGLEEEIKKHFMVALCCTRTSMTLWLEISDPDADTFRFAEAGVKLMNVSVDFVSTNSPPLHENFAVTLLRME